MLSLDWHESDATLASGGSDGTVRLWHAASGRCKFRITVQGGGRGSGSRAGGGGAGGGSGAGARGGSGDDTLVWAVRLLADGTIVSGDSRGRTQFWDGTFGTLVQSFKHHEADVLAIAVSDDSEVGSSQSLSSLFDLDHRITFFLYVS